MSKIRILIMIITLTSVVAVSLFISPNLLNPFNMDNIERKILFNIRFPRVVNAFFMGMALGVSGAVLQGILRNPLADPYILGISSGASLSAAWVILSGSYIFGKFTIPLTAFVGALFVSILVGFLGYKHRGLWPERLLLAGIGLSFLFHSILVLLMSISTNEQAGRIMFWIYGDLSTADWSLIPYALAFIMSGIFISISKAKALNALILGDEFAHSLGFSPHKERLILFISISLMTAASVSLGGIIGFIGLLIPHIMRILIGADNRFLLPASAIGGGTLLCIADLIGKSVLSPVEIPSGIVTAIIGSPYFLYLLGRRDVLSA
ncbi:MAG: FecCD family ABC transporter permease [Thermodesulfovibrionales bacterium]